MRMNPTVRLCGGFLLLLLGAACADDSGDNRPPEFLPFEPTIRASVGETIDQTYSATDPDGDSVRIVVEERPMTSSFAFSAGLARFNWTPIASDATSEGMQHNLVLAAIDNRGAKTSQRIVITVTPSNGAPRFISSAQRVLDLKRTPCLETVVQVQDDDSTDVGLTLDGDTTPRGMELTKLDGKRARLEWCPDEEQQGKAKTVYGTRITADDGSGSLVTQDFVVILVKKDGCGENNSQCSCSPPEIDHQTIRDQRGADDYEIVARITDGQSEVVNPTINFAVDPDDPDATGDYESIPMEDAGDGEWRGFIPNPLLGAGSNADVFYFICAFDNDDESGDTCDNFVCSSDDSVFHFVAFPPGDETCRADDYEPNNDASAGATPDGEEMYGLTLCEGDSDYFDFDLEAGGSLAAIVAFDPEETSLMAEILDDSGSPVASGSSDEDGAFVQLSQAPTAGSYTLAITGDPGSYDVFWMITGSTAACDDEFEPNNDDGAATDLNAGTYQGLSICEGDRDFFALQLEAGDQLDILAAFTHADGDLDMRLVNPDGTTSSRGNSVSDDEVIEYPVVTPGRYVLEVYPYSTATNDYDLDITITPGQVMQCDADDGEPGNDGPETAPVEVGDREVLWRICPEEEDWLALDLLFGERIRATLEIEDPDQDLDLTLLDTDAEDVLASSNGLEQTERIFYTAPFTGVYFLRIDAVQQDSSDYLLEVTSCINDNEEPNDTRQLAKEVEPGDLRPQLCLGENDWYKISLEAGAMISVEVDADADLSTMELTLFDTDGTTTLESGRIENTVMVLSETVDTAGDYYIRVKALDIDLQYDYDLSISVTN